MGAHPSPHRHVALAAALFLASAVPAIGQPTPDGVPAVRFRIGAEELVTAVYPGRYAGNPGRLEDDVEWTAERAEDLLEWWDGHGELLLRRIGDLAGLPWPYADVEVYLVRSWPVVSIEYPLTLALGSIRDGGAEIEIPDDPDLHALLLAHQIAHYLLDDPPAPPLGGRSAAYDHPFLAPGNFEVEAMVNWVVYTVLTEMWGASRLARLTESDLWRGYNPSHEYVVSELMPGWRLSGVRTLHEWLAAHPPGSEPFRTRDRYRREAAVGAPPSFGRTEGLSGTRYGFDVGASYDGSVFVAFVDAGSPAERAGAARGDVLLTIEGRPVTGDVEEVRRRLDASWADNREINLSVRRDGRERFLTLEDR